MYGMGRELALADVQGLFILSVTSRWPNSLMLALACTRSAILRSRFAGDRSKNRHKHNEYHSDPEKHHSTTQLSKRREAIKQLW